MKLNQQKVPLLRTLALEILDSEARRIQTILLLDEFLPALVIDVENYLITQDAKVTFEIFSEHFHPKIRIIIRLKKMEHEYTILLDSKNYMFIIGNEIGGLHANNAKQAADLVRELMCKFKTY